MLKMLMRREYALNRQNRVFGVLLIFVPEYAERLWQVYCA